MRGFLHAVSAVIVVAVEVRLWQMGVWWGLALSFPLGSLVGVTIREWWP